MKLIGFNYTKLSAEKTKSNFKDLKIESVMDIEDIEEITNDKIKSKDSFIKVSFQYILNYNPKIAKVEVKGEVVLAEEQKKVKEIMKNWKDKKVDPSLRISIFNGILRKTNVKVLEMEENINVPFHFQMPSLKPNQKK